MEARQEEQHRPDCEPDIDVGSTAEEMSHVCETRVNIPWVLYDLLLKVSQNIVRGLWPDQVEGVPASRVTTWMEHAVDRFDAWRALTARGGPGLH